jgi:hypothetical protein
MCVQVLRADEIRDQTGKPSLVGGDLLEPNPGKPSPAVLALRPCGQRVPGDSARCDVQRQVKVGHTGLLDVGPEIAGPVVGDAPDLPEQVLKHVIRPLGLGLRQVDGDERPVAVTVLHDPVGKGDTLDLGQTGLVGGGDESVEPLLAVLPIDPSSDDSGV